MRLLIDILDVWRQGYRGAANAGFRALASGWCGSVKITNRSVAGAGRIGLEGGEASVHKVGKD